MKRLLVFLAVFTSTAFGGESSLTTTFQPLNGLGSGRIFVVEVACHDWYSHSGQPTAIGLISAPNIPPTNNPKQATENLNLASLSHIRFFSGDIAEKNPALTMSAENYVNARGYPREDILRASLECLRRLLPANLLKTPLTYTSSSADKEWMGKIVDEFNRLDRSKPFYTEPRE